MPHMPQHQMPVVLIAQAAQPNVSKLYGTVSACYLSPKADRRIDSEEEYVSNSSVSPLSPAEMAWNIFPLKYPEYGQGDISTLELLRSGKGPDFQAIDTTKAKIEVLQQPEHGTLTKDLTQDIYYYPNAAYVGDDKAVFLVNL
jgi:hypothetical protein